MSNYFGNKMQVGVNHLKCASKSTRTHEHMYAHLFAPDKLYMYLYETNISNAFNNHIDPQLCTCALIIFRMTFHCVKKKCTVHVHVHETKHVHVLWMLS